MPDAILPSELVNSHNTPAGFKPAKRAKSIVPSVWPRRAKTPPSRARKGKTCPGRLRSLATAPSLVAAFIVVVRSLADTPVVRPRLPQWSR